MLPINHIKKVACCRFAILISCCLLINAKLIGQNDILSSQYMNSQLMINPAYAGVRNSFSVNVLSRQQWMGIKNAPSTYAISSHSPLNKRMASVGGSLIHAQNGPVKQSELAAVYSYLVRLNHNMFLSMGLSAQLKHYNIGLNGIDVIEDNDPSFAHNIENGIKPDFGMGAFVYSPTFYFGISMPQVLASQLNIEETGGVALEQFRSLYLTSGYAFGIGKDVFIKPSFLARLRQKANNALDLNMQIMYKNLFWVGASYRTNRTMAALFNWQLSESMGICYSYDFSVNNEAHLGAGSHEISFTIDSKSLIKRNRDRRFNRKKVTKKEEEKAVQSIRYF